MDKFKKFWQGLKPDAKRELATNAGTSLGYIAKTLSKGDTFGAKLCVSIEKITCGKVTRRELRPNDWELIWPELIDEKKGGKK